MNADKGGLETCFHHHKPPYPNYHQGATAATIN
jgi:hypothetical protein